MNVEELKRRLADLQVEWEPHERVDCLWVVGEGEGRRFTFGAWVGEEDLTLACQLSKGRSTGSERAALEHLLLLNDDLTVFRLYLDADGEVWLSGRWPKRLLEGEALEWFLFDFAGFCDDLFDQFRDDVESDEKTPEDRDHFHRRPR